jgi:hypothetical protein
MIRKREPIIAIILFVINKFIVEYFENKSIDTITIQRFEINIPLITLLINNKLDKYFDLEMIFTLSLETKFWSHIIPVIVTKVIKMKREIPVEDNINSVIKSGIIPKEVSTTKKIEMNIKNITIFLLS